LRCWARRCPNPGVARARRQEEGRLCYIWAAGRSTRAPARGAMNWRAVGPAEYLIVENNE
jgi:hypothetical protein